MEYDHLEDDLTSMTKGKDAVRKKIKDHYELQGSSLTCRKCGFSTNSVIIAQEHLKNCPRI